MLKGVLAEELTVAVARKFVGNTLDLKSAYKQVAVAQTSRAFAVVAVWDPEACCERLYVSTALPFWSERFSLGI